jgi:hypothetical protein
MEKHDQTVAFPSDKIISLPNQAHTLLETFPWSPYHDKSLHEILGF